MATTDRKLGIFGAIGSVAASLTLFEGGITRYEALAIVLMGAASVALFMSQHLNRAYTMILVRLRSDDYVLVRAEARDIKHILALATSEFGESGVTSTEQTKRLLYRNRDIFWVLLAQDHKRHKDSIAGYICLIPMDATCCSDADNDCFDVKNVDTAKLPRQRDPIDGIYIGGVVGTNLRAKSQILGHLISKAEELAQHTSRRAIYARAASKDGLRLVNKHDFAPIESTKAGLNALFRKIIDAPEDGARI